MAQLFRTAGKALTFANESWKQLWNHQPQKQAKKRNTSNEKKWKTNNIHSDAYAILKKNWRQIKASKLQTNIARVFYR